MKSAKIFLVGDDEDELTPMVETPYDKEDILQVLLERYTDLLPGDQITPEDPRRWLLVKREMEVPGEEGEGGRFSLDHLFLDQDGIPTFVECKRASNTQIRREVVAQMLDYAANGIEYWSIDRLREAAAETPRKHGKSLNDEIKQLINAENETEVDNFWKRVEANLSKGNVRLIFVADYIPKELRRLVEFLNAKLTGIQVLAVEIKQFLGEGRKVLVPRVIGLTAIVKPPNGESIVLNPDEFLTRCLPSAAPVFQTILNSAAERNDRIYWGKGGFSVGVYLPKEGQYASFAYCYLPNGFDFYFAQLPLSDEAQLALRKELLKFDIFEEAGKKTLKAKLEGNTIDRVHEVYNLILDEMDKMVRAQQEV